MALSLGNFGKKLWDQVNMLDNGRTWKNPNPTNNRSILGQVTHNAATNVAGGFLVKPVVSTVREPVRAAMGYATGNEDAGAAALRRFAEESIPGQIANMGIDTGQAGYNLEFKAPTLDFMGKTQEASKARTQGLRDFNRTPMGQLVRPIQFGIANATGADERAMQEVGLDTKGTGAQKYFADPVVGAIGLGLGGKALAFVKGKKKVPTQVPIKQEGSPQAVPVKVKDVGGRIKEIQSQLAKMPGEDTIGRAVFNAKQRYAEGVRKNPALEPKLRQKYEFDKAQAARVLEGRKQLAAEADQLKAHPSYQASVTGKPIVATKARDTQMVAPKVEKPVVKPVPEPGVFDGATGSQIADAVIARSERAKEGGKSSTFERWKTKFQESVVDPLQLYEKSDRQVAKLEGAELPASRSLTKMQNDVQNVNGITIDKVQKLALDENGTTLQKVMQKHRNQEPEFMAYVAAKSDLENRSFPDGVQIHPGLKTEDLQKIVSDFEQANPGAAYDAHMIKRFKDNIDSEAIQTGMGDSLVTSRQFYFPTKTVERDAKPQMTMSGNVRGSNTKRTIESRKSGAQDIDYSFQAMLDSLTGSQKKVFENRLFNEAYYRAGNGTIDMRRGTPVKGMEGAQLKGFVGNQRRALDLGENASRALSKLDDASRSRFNSFLYQAPAGVAKLVYTGLLNPVFHVVQLVKNPLVMIHNGGIRTLDPRALIHGFTGAIGKGTFGEANLTKYGANQIKGFTQTADNRKVQADMLALNKKSPAQVAEFVKDHPMTTLKEFTHFADRLFAISDRTFRSIMAAAEHNRVKGKVSKEAAMEAAARAYNEGMGNFNRVTAAARGLEPILLYSGATQAGARAFVRSYRDRPLETLAIDAAFIGGVGALINETLDSDKGEQFYTDMKKSGKTYALDDNIVIVPPTATRDEKTGEWKGVFKIPLAPDFRPLNRAIRKERMGEGWHIEDVAGHFTGDSLKSTVEIPKNNPTISAVSVAMNRDPRYGNQIDSEFQKQTLAPKDRVNDNTTDFAKSVGQITGLSPQKVDKWLDNAGLAGDVLQNKKGSLQATVLDSFQRQFGKGLKGESKGTKFYNNLETASKSLKSEDDWVAFKLLHTKNNDKTVDDPAAKAAMLLAKPNVLEAERRLDALARKRGEAGNPFYDLTPEQQNAVLRYRSNKAMNAAKQNYTKNGMSLYEALGLDNKWYQDFRNKENDFYKKIGKGDGGEKAASTYSGKPYEKNDAMEKLQEEFFALPTGDGPRGGNKSRAAFMNAHPELKEYWAKKDDMTNAERLALGLKIEDDSSSSSSSSNGGYSYSRGYSRRSGGGGGGSSSVSVGSEYEFAVSPTAGVATAKKKPTVKATQKGKKRVARKVGKPKVTLKKSTA